MNEQAKRFEKIETEIFGGKVRNRCQNIECVNTPKNMPGDFLARLWTLFGSPNRTGEDGFSYNLRDRTTQLEFTAYSGASGPAYGAYPKDAENIRAVLDVFDILLDETTPSDCEIRFETDFGIYETGFRNGEGFENYTPKMR